jgi:RNA polymerase sigma factor (sigma-70 family)
MDKLSDIELVEGIRSGSDKHLQMVYTKNYLAIKSMVITNSGSEDDAKDIYQEAMIVFYENCKKEGFKLTCKIQTYLYSISKNLWLKKLNKVSSKNISLEKDVADTVNVESEIIAFEEESGRLKMLEKAFEKLGESCTKLLKMFYFEGLKMDQISAKMGYTNADNAKNQKYKCFKRLKQIMTS